MPTPDVRKRWSVRDADGSAWYYLEGYPRSGAVLDERGEPMAPAASPRGGWWRATAPTKTATVVSNQRGPLLGYTRAPGAPDSLPYFVETTDIDNYNREMYLAERGPDETVETVIDLRGHVLLDGPRDPLAVVPAGATWVASLPVELTNHPEYLHLFPGALHGFSDALKAALNEIPGISAYNNAGSPFKVYASRRGAREVTLPPGSVPTRVEGKNLAAAAVAWQQRLSEVVEYVRDYAVDRVCVHCDGTGTLLVGQDTQEAARQRIVAALRRTYKRSPTIANRAEEIARIAVNNGVAS